MNIPSIIVSKLKSNIHSLNKEQHQLNKKKQKLISQIILTYTHAWTFTRRTHLKTKPLVRFEPAAELKPLLVLVQTEIQHTFTRYNWRDGGALWWERSQLTVSICIQQR